MAFRRGPSSSAGGAGGGWSLAAQELGDSLANWTATTGAWSTDGTYLIQTTDVAPAHLRYNVKQPTSALIMEADITLFSSDAYQSTAPDKRAGLIIGYDGTNNSGCLGRLHMNAATGDAVEIEQDTNSGRLSVPIAWGGENQEQHLRLVLMGNADIYLNGALVGSAGNTPDGSNNASYVGLMTGNVSAKFRNVRVWTRGLPA